MAVAMFSLHAGTSAWAQYNIGWFTISGGGGAATSAGSFTVAGTIGQPVAGTSGGGNYSVGSGFWRGGSVPVDVGDPGSDLSSPPLSFQLHAPVPNPFVQQMLIKFELAHGGPLRLRLYDATGRVVRTIVEGTFAAGRYLRPWDGKDEGGRPVSAGIYFLRLDVGRAQAAQKVVVVK